MEIEIDQATIQKDRELYQVYLDTYYAKTKDTTGHIKYGTAGFRSHADNLPHVALRIGLFEGLISKISSTQVLGITITASHNKAIDNGIKQTDFDGGMLRKQLEDQVNDFVVEQDLHVAVANLEKVLSTIDGYDRKNTGMIFLGRDTRDSGPKLCDLLRQGVEAVGSLVKDLGVITTPITHYLVRYFNLEEHSLTRETAAEELLQVYFNEIKGHFNSFYDNLPTPYVKREKETILLDCANGVGGLQITNFFDVLKDKYNVVLINANDTQYLNDKCGAEYLHKQQTYPRTAVDELKKLDIANTRCVAFDGDADRIVYYLPQEGLESIKLLDGDRYIVLFAKFFQTIIQDIHSLYQEISKDNQIAFNEDLTKWVIGMVQTPYANGSSTQYLRDVVKVHTQMSPNGVKNLHPRAHKYDVGIYCESNGHGTFLLSDEKNQVVRSFKQIGEVLLQQYPDNEKVAKFVKLLNVLAAFANTQNQINGDAMTDFLCIEEALAYLNITAQDWHALYADKKCQNATVVIRDRTKLKVNETEDKVVEPVEIQDAIDKIVAQFPGSRSFARPSGTEDIVRVYVEDDNADNIAKLTALVSEVIVNNKVIN